MRRLAKKIVAAALSITLVLAVGTTCMAAAWGSYFGQNEGWYEGAAGSLGKNTSTGFEANIDEVGWGGVWGAQVYKTSGINLKKGQSYTLSFTIKATNVTKYVYVKIAKDETLAYSTWIKLTPNKAVKFSKTFTAKSNATSVYFGLGGDIGDRVGVSTETDAEIRYSVLGNNYQELLSEDANGDFSSATKITVSNFKIESAKPAKVTLKSVKAAKGGKAKVTYKKATGAAGYQVQYSLKSNMKSAKSVTSTKTTCTIKKLTKGKKYYVRVRAYNKGKKAYGAWSGKKSVTAK
jgi:hypothetical protein